MVDSLLPFSVSEEAASFYSDTRAVLLKPERSILTNIYMGKSINIPVKMSSREMLYIIVPVKQQPVNVQYVVHLIIC